jgi:hypothetical protein
MGTEAAFGTITGAQIVADTCGPGVLCRSCAAEERVLSGRLSAWQQACDTGIADATHIWRMRAQHSRSCVVMPSPEMTHATTGEATQKKKTAASAMETQRRTSKVYPYPTSGTTDGSLSTVIPGFTMKQFCVSRFSLELRSMLTFPGRDSQRPGGKCK